MTSRTGKCRGKLEHLFFKKNFIIAYREKVIVSVIPAKFNNQFALVIRSTDSLSTGSHDFIIFGKSSSSGLFLLYIFNTRQIVHGEQNPGRPTFNSALIILSIKTVMNSREYQIYVSVPKFWEESSQQCREYIAQKRNIMRNDSLLTPTRALKIWLQSLDYVNLSLFCHVFNLKKKKKKKCPTFPVRWFI